MRALGTLLVLLGLLAGPALATASLPVAAAAATAPAPVAARSGAAFEERVMAQINVVRKRAGLKRLRLDSCLQRLSSAWGEHLADMGDLVHRDQQQVLRRCRRSWVGENLVEGVGVSPKAIVRAWLNSPGHRAIMLKPRATRAGLAVAIDGRGCRFGVLNVADARRR